MPVTKITNSVQDRLSKLRKTFDLNPQLDTRNEVIEILIGIFDQVEEIRKKYNLTTIEEVLTRCDKMEKEFIEPENEIRNNKLDEQYSKLLEIKEAISATKADLLDKLKKLDNLEERLSKRDIETQKKIDTLRTEQREIKEILTPQQLESPFEPEVLETLKKYSKALSKGDDNRLLVYLMNNYNPEHFQTRYKPLYDKYLGTE